MSNNSATRRVLVVDDELLIRWALAETLTESGYEVVQAGDRVAAVKAVSDGSQLPDVVLLDFRLPDSNDLGLLSELRRLAPLARIILMTAFGTPEIIHDAIDIGAYQVVSKPFRINEVTTLVSEAIGAR